MHGLQKRGVRGTEEIRKEFETSRNGGVVHFTDNMQGAISNLSLCCLGNIAVQGFKRRGKGRRPRGTNLREKSATTGV